MNIKETLNRIAPQMLFIRGVPGAKSTQSLAKEVLDYIEELEGLLNEIETMTATGEGLDPFETIQIHVMANIREIPEAKGKGRS